MPKLSIYEEGSHRNESRIAQHDFYHLFQPVYHLSTAKTLGHEALIRSKSNISPDQLFQAASRQRRLYEMDTLSIDWAISAYFSSRPTTERSELLFINIFPSTMAVDAFPAFVDTIIDKYPSVSNRVVFEINESLSEKEVWNNGSFRKSAAYLRELGFLIALDDVGEGASTLKNIVLISPDFIKLDRFFSQELFACKKKQKIIRLFTDYCKDECRLILEGIEEQDDLLLAQTLGVTLGQGFLLGKPQSLPGTTKPTC